MWQQNPMYNQPYGYGYNQPQTQAIQNVNQQIQKQAACYFVKAPEELAGVNVMPNIFYLGINREGKEIYVRRMNNDGNIEVEKYTLSSGVKEKTELQTIVERLDRIEKKLTEAKDESPVVNAL
jgi:hypothetical protein